MFFNYGFWFLFAVYSSICVCFFLLFLGEWRRQFAMILQHKNVMFVEKHNAKKWNGINKRVIARIWCFIFLIAHILVANKNAKRYKSSSLKIMRCWTIYSMHQLFYIAYKCVQCEKERQLKTPKKTTEYNVEIMGKMNSSIVVWLA